REGMFQSLGFGMHPLEGNLERFGEKQLPEPVMSDNFERGLGARLGQLDPTVTVMSKQSGFDKPRNHVRGRGRGYPQVVGESRCRDFTRVRLKSVDSFKVVFDCLTH